MIPIQEVVEQIKLNRMDFHQRGLIPKRVLELEPDLNAHIDRFTHDMVLQLDAFIFGQDLESFSIQHPKDWWEAVKERFMPEWLKTKFPVVYARHQINPKALFPHVKAPPNQPYIFWFSKETDYNYLGQ
jgi:hypothetical protein